MQNHEYEDAIRRELRAHQLAAIRLQRLEAERQAVLDMAMQRSLGLVHQPTTSLYYVEPPVSRPVLEDSWWAAPVRPRSYEPWQPPASHQLPPEPFLVQRNVVTDPPVAPIRTWAPDDPSMQRKSLFGAPATDRKGMNRTPNSPAQPSFPVSNAMGSPSIVAQRSRTKLKLPSKNKPIAPQIVGPNTKVVDPKDKPKKRGRPLGSKNAVTVPKPTPPRTRTSWKGLGLGMTMGTPAYNAHQRAVHRASGQQIPEVLTTLDFARKIYSVRLGKVALPDQSPLQIFLEKTRKVSESPQALSIAETDDLIQEDKKKRARKSFMDGSDVYRQEEMIRDLKRHKKEKKKKKGENSNGSTAFATYSDAPKVQTDHDRVAMQQTTPESLDVMTPFPHALHRLYQTILEQDKEDCSTDMNKSHEWSIEDVRIKMQGFEDEIAELDKMERQIVKESKQLNGTNLAVLEEAYQLLGVMPPEGC